MVYVISDLHGYSPEKFRQLLKLAEFSDNDICYVLGDVIDRGEDGAKLLEWIMYQPNMIFIAGNHEMMLLENKFLFELITEESIARLDEEQMEALSTWQLNGGEPTMRGLAEMETETVRSIVEFIEDSPLYETVVVNGTEYLLTHSGIGNFDANRPIEDYSAHELLWNRPTGDEVYYPDKITVFGHTPTAYLSAKHRGKVIFTDTWIDIDTGAAGGLPPTLLRLDDMKEFRIE